MKDQIEDFIQQNRSAFDDKEPSEKVWNGVERALTFSNISWWNSVMLWRAAAVVFMTLSLYLLIPKEQSQKQNELALKEFTDVENFYFEQISEKVELIGSFERNEGLNGFTRDFEQLEAMYMVLKEEMKTHPSKKVKDALVLNLLVRIDLLNQQLHKLEKDDKPEAKDRPKAST
jgi:hypothetical protein